MYRPACPRGQVSGGGCQVVVTVTVVTLKGGSVIATIAPASVLGSEALTTAAGAASVLSANGDWLTDVAALATAVLPLASRT